MSKSIVEADIRKTELNITDFLQVVPSLVSIVYPQAGFIAGLADTEKTIGKNVRQEFRDKWNQFEFSENPERYDPSRFQSWTGNVKDLEIERRSDLLSGKIKEKASEEEINKREENRDMLDWVVDNAYKYTAIGGDRDVIINNVNTAAQAIQIAKSVSNAVKEQRLRAGQMLTENELNTKVNPNSVVWDNQSNIFRWKDPSANTKLGAFISEVTNTPLDRFNNFLYQNVEPEKLLVKNIGDFNPNVRQPLIGFTTRDSLTSALKQGRVSVGQNIMKFVNANPVLKKGAQNVQNIYDKFYTPKIGRRIAKLGTIVDDKFERLGRLKQRFDQSKVGKFLGKISGSQARKRYRERINKYLYV